MNFGLSTFSTEPSQISLLGYYSAHKMQKFISHEHIQMILTSTCSNNEERRDTSSIKGTESTSLLQIHVTNRSVLSFTHTPSLVHEPFVLC